MNTLIEEMVERGLAQEVAAVEADLSETLAALERYRGSAETEWAVFARAEGEVDEPIRTTHLDDPHGVKSAFA